MLFIENFNKIKQKFIWETPFIQMFCAAVFASAGKTADTGTVIRERKLLMQNSACFPSGWSTFSAAASAVIAAGVREVRIKEIPQTCRILKQNGVPDSVYLPLAACILTASAEAEEKISRLCERTAFLYSRTGSSPRELISAVSCALTAEAEGIEDEKLYSRYMTANYLLSDLNADFVRRAAMQIFAETDDIGEKCRVIRAACEEFPAEEIPTALFALRPEEIPAACRRFREVLTDTEQYAGNAARACAAYITLSEYHHRNPLIFLTEMPDCFHEEFRAS